MKKINHSFLARKILNIIGGAAYVSCLMQWLWTILIFLPIIVSSPFFTLFLSSEQTPAQPLVQTQASSSAISPLVSFGGVALGIIILAVSIYVIVVKVPKSIARTGEKITHTPVDVIVPVIVKHSHLMPAQKKLLPDAVIISIKLILTFVPLYLLTLAGDQPIRLSFAITMLVGTVLFSWSFFMFALQLLLSRFLRVDYRTIR